MCPDSRASLDQRVQVLEGSRAMIYTGNSQPIRERRFIQTPGGVISQEVTAVQDTRMGFEVVPRVADSTVQVDIAGAAGSRRVWLKVDLLP